MSSLTISLAGAVVTVSLNRPQTRNAFDDQLIAELTAWARDPLPPEVRVAVLRGEGKVFCAGADLTWMSRMVAYSHEQNVADARMMSAMFLALDTLPAPLIGRVHGAALGGGAGLAAVCDIVVAAEDAVFGFTEAKLGILPAVISPFAVAKIGQSAARELFLTASRFTADRARELGLVHTVVPEADLDSRIELYVRDLMSSAPDAVATAKRLIAQVAGVPPADVANLTAETIASQRVSAEGQAGMRAFLEKRRAPWLPDGF
jgi:methylglutaconyl-CoA hydratase